MMCPVKRQANVATGSSGECRSVRSAKNLLAPYSNLLALLPPPLAPLAIKHRTMGKAERMQFFVGLPFCGQKGPFTFSSGPSSPLQLIPAVVKPASFFYQHPLWRQHETRQGDITRASIKYVFSYRTFVNAYMFTIIVHNRLHSF